MTIYHLYRSGIRYATFQQYANKWTVRELNVQTNKWQPSQPLTEAYAKEIEQFYRLNPIKLLEKTQQFRVNFRAASSTILSIDGETYENAGDGLWVQRLKKFPIDILTVQDEPIAFISTARKNCHVLVKDSYESYTPVKQWEKGISPALYGVQHLNNFAVKMRDGVHLSTDVWLPTGVHQPIPTIFVRTPYGRLSYEKTYTHFVQRGYAVVIQDTRGREESEGEWFPMTTEMEDGDDSLQWIADQEWCDGNIGMIGASYGGFVQWAAAASGNPHLKALVSIVTAGSPFVDLPRKGGAFVSGTLAWAFAMAEKKFKPENMSRNDWDKVINIRPLKDIPLLALGKSVPFWDKWMEHRHNDNFWRQSDWTQYKDKMKAPALIASGWFDDNGMGTTEAIESTSHYPVEDRRIILGPWMHNANTTRDIQGVALGNHALRYDLDYLFQQWFDLKLKGTENSIMDLPPVEYYTTGDDKWRSSNEWPPENGHDLSLFLASDGYADKVSGSLNTEVKEGHQFDCYTYDPDDAAPHLIDLSENEIGVPADYQEVEKRADVLVYTSDYLTEPLTIAGEMQIKLFAASSAKDTDWMIRLSDVDESGRSIKLTDGVLRARYRYGFDCEVLLEENKIESYTIRSAKFAHTFQKGHRIRLTITSSAKAFIFPNTNTGADPATDTKTQVAQQKVYHGQDYPSRITLPVLIN